MGDLEASENEVSGFWASESGSLGLGFLQFTDLGPWAPTCKGDFFRDVRDAFPVGFRDRGFWAYEGFEI